MDLMSYANDFAAVLLEECESVEMLGEAEPSGTSWFFQLRGGMSGFASCEDNADDLGVPTVSIALSLGDITEVPREGLLALLARNGDMLGASLTASDLGDDTTILLIQHRIPVESFEPAEFGAMVEHLLSQITLFLGDDITEDDSEAGQDA